MIVGKPFEVSKEVYERAKKRCEGRDIRDGYYWMDDDDRKELFSASILYGYGLYNCKVHEEDGKYICTYETGSTCD